MVSDRQRIINSYEAAFQFRDWETVAWMQDEYPWIFETTQAEYDEAMRAMHDQATIGNSNLLP